MTRPLESNLTSSNMASPRPMETEPSIWASTEVQVDGLNPQSWASVMLSIVTWPVSRSTVTSATWAEQP